MRLGGIALITVLLLSACSSEAAPKEPDDPVPSTSATPSIPVPTPPAQAAEDSPEGAAAFVKHYVDVFNYAAAKGDVEELTRLSSPDCKGCQSYIERFEQIYADGDRISSQLWTLSSDGLQIDRDNKVAAWIDVNENAIKRYRFYFGLPSAAPYSVNNITIEAKS